MADVSAGVLTVSDRCSSGEAEDISGPNLKALLSAHPELQILEDRITTACVPDDKELIKKVILEWTDTLGLSLILTTGGTGFSPRDVTPEAVRPLLDKEAPGLMVAMMSKSLAVTPMAMLSRPVCGVRKASLIATLPGSRKGSQECLSFILPALPHALDLLRGSLRASHTHTAMQTRAEHIHTCPHGHSINKTGKRTQESFYPVALRPRQSPYPMLSVSEALDIIIQHTPVPTVTEERHISDSLFCVITESIEAKLALPPFPASIKDGYAVRSSDGTGVRTVITPITAGETPTVVVTAGTVARITTGAPVPSGADAIVQVEDTELVESSDNGEMEKSVNILTAVRAGHDIRTVGSDIGLGERVIGSGELLNPTKIGLAASIGVSKVKVFKPPTIAVLSTGNEVVNTSDKPRPGQIYDSNRPTILSLVKQHHFKALDLGIAQDNRETLVDVLRKGLEEADVLVTTGGVSMGEKDLLKPVLESDIEAKIHFGRVFMKPGKPTTFATAMSTNKKKLVFALPGNPVSATVTFHLFVLPALKRLAGWTNVDPTIISAKLDSKVNLDPRPEYHRVQLSWNGGDLPIASSTGGQRSSKLVSLRNANGLMILPPSNSDLSELPKGSLVKVMLLS